MSKYINKGNDGFTSVCNSDFIDKSMLIEQVNRMLNTENRYMCVTRARRFGKSVAIKMLNAYYDQSCDSSVLFENLAIQKCADFSKHLNKYPVIYLDMTDFITKYGNDKFLLKKMKQEIMEELHSIYQDVTLSTSDDLMDLLVKIVSKTGQQFICLLDEWDALCREGSTEQMDDYVDFLRRLFKGSNTEKVFACVYMTGILPIKRYNTQSALNNFEEYTMLSPAELAPFFGFTETETAKRCKDSGMDYAKMKYWYDGYQIGSEKAMFNPYAVSRAIKRKQFENCWTSTNSFESLQRYISMNFDGLKDDITKLLADVPVQIQPLRFGNDMNSISSKDDVLTLLCHLGYLSYNCANNEIRIPNHEVRQEFENAIAESGWEAINQALQMSEEALQSVLNGDGAKVAEIVEKVHQENTSILQYNDENALACVLSLAFYTARKKYLMIREFPSGKGFADIVMLPFPSADLPVIVLELKYNKSASSAIHQIRKQEYFESLQQYVAYP